MNEDLLKQFETWRQSVDKRVMSYMSAIANLFLEKGKTIIEAGDAWDEVMPFIGGFQPAVDVTAREILIFFDLWRRERFRRLCRRLHAAKLRLCDGVRKTALPAI